MFLDDSHHRFYNYLIYTTVSEIINFIFMTDEKSADPRRPLDAVSRASLQC